MRPGGVQAKTTNSTGKTPFYQRSGVVHFAIVHRTYKPVTLKDFRILPNTG